MTTIYSTSYPWPIYTPGTPWDNGVTWVDRAVPSVDTALALDVPYVRDRVLRVANGSEDDLFIEAAIRAATAAAEHDCQVMVVPQTRIMTLTGFPASGRIELPWKPVRSVSAVMYYDGDNGPQELAGTPADYLVLGSSTDAPAVITPLVGASFPSTATRIDAVEVTYEAGFDPNDPELFLITAGIGAMVAEMYKTRSLSAPSGGPSVLQQSRFWHRRW